MFYCWFVGLLVSLCNYVAVDPIRHLLWEGTVFIHLLIDLKAVIFIEDKL